MCGAQILAYIISLSNLCLRFSRTTPSCISLDRSSGTNTFKDNKECIVNDSTIKISSHICTELNSNQLKDLTSFFHRSFGISHHCISSIAVAIHHSIYSENETSQHLIIESHNSPTSDRLPCISLL